MEDEMFEKNFQFELAVWKIFKRVRVVFSKTQMKKTVQLWCQICWNAI